MSRLVELARKEVRLEHLPTDERFQWERRKHVDAETESGNVDECIVFREVVQDVAQRLVFERPVASYAHRDRGNGRNRGRVVRHFAELVHARFFETAVDH